MKKEYDYLATSLWYKEEITDPYEVFNEFFHDSDLPTHREMTADMLMAAASERVYDKTTPSDVLLQFKFTESVINAAYLINKEEKESRLKIGKSDVFNPNLYCSWHKDLTEWDFFPRELSLKEYINPYLVFKRFFVYKELPEWKEVLQEILDYTLANDSIYETLMRIDTLSIYFHLSKLIEAAHLIDVRETNQTKGYIKNRI